MNASDQPTLHEGDLPSGLRLEGDLAIDTETMGLHHHRDRLCLVQLADAKGDIHLVRRGKDALPAPNLTAVLKDASRTKLFHYARFDLAALATGLGVWCAPVYCTRTASRLARTYSDRHSLRELCREFLGIDLSKKQQSSDWGSLPLSPAQLAYAANDVRYLHALREGLDSMLAREGRDSLARECYATIALFARLDLAGFEADVFGHA